MGWRWLRRPCAVGGRRQQDFRIPLSAWRWRLCRTNAAACTGGAASSQRNGSGCSGSGGASPTEATMNFALVELKLKGNFLFGPAELEDFEAALLPAGLDPRGWGDVILAGEKDAQLVAAPACAAALHGRRLQVRTVEVQAVAAPGEHQPRAVTTAEASCRLDALAPAGLGCPAPPWRLPSPRVGCVSTAAPCCVPTRNRDRMTWCCCGGGARTARAKPPPPSALAPAAAALLKGQST